MSFYEPTQILDLIESVSELTVKQLRDRIRQLRDTLDLHEKCKGLWKLRKKALVRLLAEIELELLPGTAIEKGVEGMLFKQIEASVAASVIKGAARGAKALGSDDLGEFKAQVEQIKDDVDANTDVFTTSLTDGGESEQAKGLEQKPTQDAKPAPKRGTAKK